MGAILLCGVCRPKTAFQELVGAFVSGAESGHALIRGAE